MKTFRTDVSIIPSIQPIGHQNKVFTIGSCFADAIGKRLQRYKFQTLVNPFGVVYNPLSIHKVLQYAIGSELPAVHSYAERHQINFNYDFHSEMSALDKSQLQNLIKYRIDNANEFLKNAQYLLITYGTAWIFTRNDTNEVVANCHKMPADSFTKSLLTEMEIIKAFDNLYHKLIKLNPDVKIILTLSPVRHIKDTLELNSVSKSVLRLACHHIATKYNAVEYFPAYEIMMDDLRDYRFYKADMLHPTEEAEEYIWDKFSDRYFSSDTKMFFNQWNSIRSALAHKPFHPYSAAHQQFLKDTLSKLQELKTKVDVMEELTYVQSQLKQQT